MNNNHKSATTAGLLGIFLGGFGAHNWYLGEKKKGIIHVSLVGGAILLIFIADIILPATLSARSLFTTAGLILFLNWAAILLISGSSIWGLIEGIIILTKGDVGLAQRGIPTTGEMAAVAPTPVAQPANSYQPATTAPVSNTTAPMTNAENTAAPNIPPTGATIQNLSNLQVINPAPVKPPKQPMDPAKKKRIIRGVVIGVLALVAVVAVAITASILLKVDYSTAYRAAKELSPEVAAVYQNTDCTHVLDYVDSTYTKPADYNEYADNCLTAGNEVDTLTKKLGETAGVKRNKEIKTQFDKFSEGVSATLPDQDVIAQKLSLYKAWHEYAYLLDDLTISSVDSAVQAAAAPLLNSGNETLKTYGEKWQASVLAITQAYREYDNLSYSDPNKSAMRIKYQTLQSDHNNWVAANKPNIQSLGELDFNNDSKMYNEWTKLYNMISQTYEEHYNSGSGDCSELFGEVYCD